jgi:WD40 repeat protein
VIGGIQPRSADDADDCLRAELLIAAGAESPLAHEDATFLPDHLSRCSACREAALEPPMGDDHGLPCIAPDNFVIGAEIGRGGMGRVLSARDLRIGRAVAIKEMLSARPDARLRFEREARITARLQHPGIVSVYEVGRWPDGRPFYAMPILTGRTLREAIAAAPGPVQRLHLLPAVIAAADAVAYAHSRRIIHRDLTPSNILLGSFGETIVIDWGIAKDLDDGTLADGSTLAGHPADSLAAGLTVVGAIVGTPAYIAPEQAAGSPVDERADVYALGAILYQVLTGRPPYDGQPAPEVIARLQARKPPAVLLATGEVPRDLVSVVEKAMHVDPASRYPTAAALVDDLRRQQNRERVAAHVYSRAELTGRWLSRRLALVIAAAVALAVVAAVAVVAGIGVTRERDRSNATTTSLLIEQGRQEALAGHPARAVAYLTEAYRRGDRSGALRFLLASVQRSTEAGRSALADFDSPFKPIAASLSFSPNGEHLAIAFGGKVAVKNVVNAAEIAVIEDGQRPLQFVTHSRDGAWLLTWNAPGSSLSGITIWDVRTWKAVRVLAPGRDVTGIRLSHADGSVLVWGPDDRGVEIWDIASGRLIRSFASPRPGERLAGRFSPDGRQVAIFGGNEAPVVKDLATGQTIVRLPGDQAMRLALEISSDGRRMVTAGEGGAKLWELPSGRLVADLVRGENVGRVSISSDGARVLTQEISEQTKLWDAMSGAAVTSLGRAHNSLYELGSFETAGFSPDGARVATQWNGVIQIWAAGGGAMLEAYQGKARAQFLTFSPDGRWMATVDEDASIRLWDVGNSALAGAVKLSKDPAETSDEYLGGLRGLDTQGDRVFTTSAQGALQVWDRRGRATAATAKLAGTRLLSLSADGTRALVRSGSGSLRPEVRATTTGEVLLRLDVPPEQPVGRAGMSPRGSWILTSGESGGTQLWDAHTGDKANRLTGFTHEVAAFAFSPDESRLFLIESTTGRAGLWEPRSGRQIAALDVAQGTAGVFSPDGQTLAVTGDRVSLWDARDGSFQYGIDSDLLHVQVTFSRDSSYLAVLGDAIQIVDVARGKEMATWPTPAMRGAIFASDSSVLITTAKDVTTVMDWRTQRTLAQFAGSGPTSRPWDSGGRGWTPDLYRTVDLSADGGVLAVHRRDVAIDLWRLGFERRSPEEIAVVARPWPEPWKLVDGILVAEGTASEAHDPTKARSLVPQNLDFETGRLGEIPPSWEVSDPAKPNLVSISNEEPRQGKASALLLWSPAPDAKNGLLQVFDARPYRSKFIRLRAALRCPLGTPAVLLTRAQRKGLEEPTHFIFVGPRCTGQWQDEEISFYVPRDADDIGICVALMGPGKIWADDFSLAVVAPGQGPAPTPGLEARAAPAATRPADDILDDFVSAVGGEKVFRHRTLYLRSRVGEHFENFPGITQQGLLETWLSPGNKRSTSAGLLALRPGLSDLRCNQDACWVFDRNGVSRVSGAAEQTVRLDVNAMTAVQMKAEFPHRKVVAPPAGAPTGSALECVELSLARIAPRVECFDRASHLRIYEETADSGEAHRTEFSDYRWVAGMRLPFREVRIEGRGLVALVYTTDVQAAKADGAMAPDLFRSPDVQRSVEGERH